MVNDLCQYVFESVRPGATLGLYADRTEVRFSMGHEVYIADVQNNDGNWQLRFVSIENLPHMITPQMAELSWEFLRRFARQPDGTIKELNCT